MSLYGRPKGSYRSTQCEGTSVSPTALNTAQPIDLARRAMLKLPDAAGLHISCRSGSLWITLDGDTRDYIVEAGEQFTTAAHRPAIIYALQPATVLVQAQRPAAPAAAPARAPAAGPVRSGPRWPAGQQPVAVR